MPLGGGYTNTPGALNQQSEQTQDIDCPSCEYSGPFVVLNTNAPGDKVSAICPNCRKQSSTMAITPMRDNGGQLMKDERGHIKLKHTAQKRDKEGLPTKDNYRGPRIPSYDEELGPQDVDSISPFTEERQDYKYESKPFCCASYVPGSLEELLIKEAQSFGMDEMFAPIVMDSATESGSANCPVEFCGSDNTSALSDGDYMCNDCGFEFKKGDGLDSLASDTKQVKTAQKYDEMMWGKGGFDRPSMDHSRDISVSDPMGEDMDDSLDTWDCDLCGGTVIPQGKLGSRVHGRCRNCGMNSSYSLAEVQEKIVAKASKLTTEELSDLQEPGVRAASGDALKKMVKTADGSQPVHLNVGPDCQWCPKLRRSVSYVVCSDYCIDGRREPVKANKKDRPESYTDYLLEGGDPNGKVVCGYKLWIEREMDRQYPGWLNDHIKKAGGKIVGSDTPFGNQRINLDEGQRGRLPSYPQEFNVEKLMEERRHDNPDTRTDND